MPGSFTAIYDGFMMPKESDGLDDATRYRKLRDHLLEEKITTFNRTLSPTPRRSSSEDNSTTNRLMPLWIRSRRAA